MTDPTPTVESVTTHWRLDPPVDLPTDYQPRNAKTTRMVRVTVVGRTTTSDGTDHWSVRGIPLTSTGKPNGGQDWRIIRDDDLTRLAALCEATEARNARI